MRRSTRTGRTGRHGGHGATVRRAGSRSRELDAAHWHRPSPLSIPALDRPGGALRFPLSPEESAALVRMALEEDGAFNDVTTIATVVSARRARGAIVARRAGTVSRRAAGARGLSADGPQGRHADRSPG